MLVLTREQKMYNVLRIACSMCFIGHGIFGIITKPIWVNYFAVFGIGHEMAYNLMPVIGSIDILLGLALIFYPIPAIAGWLVIWAIITALLRPLSGEPFAECIERAGNFGAPLGLLMVAQMERKKLQDWFKPFYINTSMELKTKTKITDCLKYFVFFILLGHGGLNILEKKSLLHQYSALGFSNAATTAQLIGLTEIMAAFIVLIRPSRSMIFVLFIWKMASELFYPNFELIEFIERGGSYGVLFSLWLSLDNAPYK